MAEEAKLSKLGELIGKVDAMSVRERTIFSAVILVVVLFIFLEWAWAPAWDKQQALQQQIGATDNELDGLSSEMNLLQQQLAQDPNAELLIRQRQLTEQLRSREVELRKSLSRLVTPEEVTSVLRELLGVDSGLRIIEVKKLPVTVVRQGEGEDAARLYSHKLKVVIEGGYFATMQYLRKIETSVSRMRLVAMDYQVEQYPGARVELQVETIGLDERWLGV